MSIPYAVFIVLSVFIGFRMAGTVLAVGKPRRPLTPQDALGVLFVGLLQLAALSYLVQN